MIRFGVTLAALLAATSAAGCGAGSTREPAAPPPRSEPPRTEVERGRDHEAPKLIAPPPAYGNKVVMARGLTTSHLR